MALRGGAGQGHQVIKKQATAPAPPTSDHDTTHTAWAILEREGSSGSSSGAETATFESRRARKCTGFDAPSGSDIWKIHRQSYERVVDKTRLTTAKGAYRLGRKEVQQGPPQARRQLAEMTEKAMQYGAPPAVAMVVTIAMQRSPKVGYDRLVCCRWSTGGP